MILVLLGTFHIEFPRPLAELHKLAANGKLNEEIIVQNGHTRFSSEFMSFHPFIDPVTLDELYDRARIIVTHAGTGSILKGVKKRKKVIAIARRMDRGEHIDDHQLEILEQFTEMQYIIPWNEQDSLEDVLKVAEEFSPRTYESKKEIIISYLKNYIDSL